MTPDNMTVKELRELLANYPDDAVVDLGCEQGEDGYEWWATLYIDNDTLMEYYF